MIKHTPGPWDFINPDGYTIRHPQVYAGDGAICNATWRGDGRIDELRANARLIAAAPDGLAFARWIADRHPDGSVEGDEARKFIAKATGESA